MIGDLVRRLLRLVGSKTSRRLFLLYVLVKAIQYFRRRLQLNLSRLGAVVITGCDTGFGRKTALQLARKRVTVLAGCLFDKSHAGLKEEVGSSELQQYLVPFTVDISKQPSVDKAMGVIQEQLDRLNKPLWALINNAGLMRGGPIDSLPLSDWELQMQVNVYGMVRMIRGCLPLLREARGGRIVNIASVAGIAATPDTSGYNASKYAVEGLSESLRRELGSWNVDVIVVEPGIMKTNLWDVVLSEDAILKQQFDRLPPKTQDLYGRKFFLKKHSAANYLVDLIGGDPQQVVDVLDQTVTRKHPHSIYGVGVDWYLFDYLRKAPVWLSDALIKMQEKWLMQGVKPAGAYA